ncbi:MAG TPA: RES family NAD+ phosphorylase [Dongiaceae bacterium]|jgi:hypothetical protein|nr:RES family NAD+ phosphorylase [Dongiaceae bacterium]
MSSSTWTRAALSSSHVRLEGKAWRIVEAQHIVSTMKLVDTTSEQERLERVLERTKPAIPQECRRLHYLLATPFRYFPYPVGSRFRRAGSRQGVFYASEWVETAIAEFTFHRLLFFSESPATPWPRNPAELTAFSFGYRTDRATDLTASPFAQDRRWRDPADYTACQAFCAEARAAGTELIRYASVRDAEGCHNFALLTCRAFSADKPLLYQTWHLHLNATGAHVFCEHPRQRLGFPTDAFAQDPRILSLDWQRRGA